MLEAILTRNRVSSWFTLHWGDVPSLANSHVHIHELRAQQSLCVKEEARRHDSLTVTSSEKYRCPEDPSAQMCVWKHRTALDSLNLLLFPQRWLESVKRWTGDALRVHLPKHLRIEFSRSPPRRWGECSFNRSTARQYWAGNHYASHSRNALFPFTNFEWCSGGRCALDWVHRLLLITSQYPVAFSLQSLKWGIESVCLAVVLVHTDVMHRSAVFQRFLHPLPAVRMIYAWRVTWKGYSCCFALTGGKNVWLGYKTEFLVRLCLLKNKLLNQKMWTAVQRTTYMHKGAVAFQLWLVRIASWSKWLTPN